MAISAASQHWGGRGFVLVPFDAETGEVHPSILETVTAFDPDYVAVMTHSAATWFRVAPTELNWPFDGSESPEKIESILADIGSITTPMGKAAGKAVQAVCTPLTYGIETELSSQLHSFHEGQPSSEGPFLAAPRPGHDTPYGALSSSMDWAGDLALFASAKTGIAPNDVGRPQPKDEDLLGWLLTATPESAPEELLWFSGVEFSDLAKNHQTWFEAASPDLSTFHSGHREDNAAVVIGDTADDFALAVMLDRMLGYCLWLTAPIVETHFAGNWKLQYALRRKLESLSMMQRIHVGSCSLSNDELRPLVAQLTDKEIELTINGEPYVNAHALTLDLGIPKLDSGLSSVFMNEHLATPVPVPVEESFDGTLTLLAPIVPPVPSAPIPTSGFGSPAWLVDVSLWGQRMPKARRIRSKWLLETRDPSDGYLLRSSRAGVTFHSGSHGFVAGGTVLASRLAIPRLQFLGLHKWVRSVADDAGVTAQLSRPGQHAQLVAKRLGSRERLLELANGPMLEVFRGYVSESTTAEKSRDVFPEEDGVVLTGNYRLLQIQAFGRLAPGLGWKAVRETIDELARARLLRQGVVLDCEECGAASFVSIEDLRQTYECARCGASNEFGLKRWKAKSVEPSWFYDLHSAFRSLLEGHGDISLLAAGSLKARSRQYIDTPELEFRSASGKRLFEIDLIASTDDGVSVVEAKSNGSLGTGDERKRLVRKRFEAAKLIRADRVVFATTRPTWSDAAVSLAQTIRDESYPEIGLDWLSAL